MKRLLCLIAAFWLFAVPSFAAIGTPYRAAATTSAASSSPLAVTTSTNIAVDDIIVVLSYSTQSRTVTEVTDTGGNSYTLPTCYAVGVYRACLAYAKATVAVTAGAAAVTIKYSNTASRIVHIWGVSGADLPADLTSSTNGSTGTGNTLNTVTPNFSNEVLFGVSVLQGSDANTIATDTTNGWTSAGDSSRASVGRLRSSWITVSSNLPVARAEVVTPGTDIWMANTFSFPAAAGPPPTTGTRAPLTGAGK